MTKKVVAAGFGIVGVAAFVVAALVNDDPVMALVIFGTASAATGLFVWSET